MTHLKDAKKEIVTTLAIDTATRAQTIALLRHDRLLAQRQSEVRANHSASLLESIDRLLGEHRLEPSDLDLIAIGLGPGGFTSLRVGLATAKAIARAAEVPLKGVSSLAGLAMAHATSFEGVPVCAALDARRREIYAGFYLYDGERLKTLQADQAWAPEALREAIIERAHQHGRLLVLNHDAEYPELMNLRAAHPGLLVAPPWAATPSAAALGGLARLRYLDERADDLTTLEPNYVRPSDAEISWAARHPAPAI